MHPKPRFMPLLLISVLCSQCASSNRQLAINESPLVLMDCIYNDPQTAQNTSEMECSLKNQGHTPARLKFNKVSLEDPDAELVPIDSSKLRTDQLLQNIVVILGVILFVAVIIAIASDAKNIPDVHLAIPSSPSTKTYAYQSQKTPSIEIVEIPAYNSAKLLFSTQHGDQRPSTLVLHLENDRSEKVFRVPVEAPYSQASKRSNFD